MNFTDVCSYSWSNLMRHKIRTALTVVGVGVGVSTLVLLVSLGTGVEKLVTDELEKAEVISRIQVLPKGLKKAALRGRQAGPPPEMLKAADVETLRQVEGVATAYPYLNPSRTLFARGRLRPFVPFEGVPADGVTEGLRSTLIEGRFWAQGEDEAQVCVIPSDLVEELEVESARAAIGMTISVSGPRAMFRFEEERIPPEVEGEPERVKWTPPEDLEDIELVVTGVVDSEKLGQYGRTPIVPQGTAQRITDELGGGDDFGGPPTEEGEYRIVVVKVADVGQVDQVIDRIEDAGYDTFSVLDILGFVEWMFFALQSALGFFGSIGLFVAFFGIANTMVMAVMERTRELGVIKALGGRNRDIRRLIFIEAALIGALGGTAGLLVGWFAGAVINAIVAMSVRAAGGAFDWSLFYVPTWLGLAAIGVATVVATLAGIYPAWRAGRLDPVVSLRTE